MSDFRSRGTRAQTHIKENEEKLEKERKGEMSRGDGKRGMGGFNKYKSPKFKALMMIK